jgi:hypothetical protein
VLTFLLELALDVGVGVEFVDRLPPFPPAELKIVAEEGSEDTEEAGDMSVCGV